jgi:hypothetical protein
MHRRTWARRWRRWWRSSFFFQIHRFNGDHALPFVGEINLVGLRRNSDWLNLNFRFGRGRRELQLNRSRLFVHHFVGLHGLMLDDDLVRHVKAELFD